MASREGHPDAGMLAVARVRGVREQDSRLGLRQAAADEREAGRRRDAVAARLAEADTAPEGDLATFLAARAGGSALAAETARADGALSVAGTVTGSARDHWQRDRTRLAAVELLLERRAAARLAERTRRETAEVDDLVAARWLRARRETS
jgi:flagellar FliJ protein